MPLGADCGDRHHDVHVTSYELKGLESRPAQRCQAPDGSSARSSLSHDTLGYGHLRRNLLIATALSEMDPRPEILLIGGIRQAGAFAMPRGVDCVTLPAYAKQSDGSYRPRELGGDLARLARLRAQAIRARSTGSTRT